MSVAASASSEIYPLVVDLDGSLLRSDMLHESFWNACAQLRLSPWRAFVSLWQGRAHFKAYLAQCADINVAHLPYDEDVLAYVRDWRAKGGQVILATATHIDLAQRIADYLGLFDDVLATSADTNLKGAKKAQRLAEYFDDCDYAYLGDNLADIAIWKNSAQPIVVGSSLWFRTYLQHLNIAHHHVPRAGFSRQAYWQALRPHQWMKNLLVFLPILVAHQWSWTTYVQAFMAFAAFSLMASHAYLLNDLLDLQADRAHPRKKDRPFAAGKINIVHGGALLLGLLISALLIGAHLGSDFLFILLFYYMLTNSYSLYFKRQIILDICVLAMLYSLRLLAGGLATGINLSMWLLAFSLFFFLSLAAIKRQAELVDGRARGHEQPLGRGYYASDIALIGQMSLAAGYVSVLVLALYFNSDAVVALYATPAWLWAICPLLLYWLSRMVMLAHRGQMHDDPLVFAIYDCTSWLCGALVFACAAIAIWP